MKVEVVFGDLLRQPVEAIVNPWNRNTIPWWLLLPQGVSGAIKKKGGSGIFRELARHGRLELGQAVGTGPGKLPFRAIIHVAGVNDLWRASEDSVRRSARNAVQLAEQMGLRSIGFPLIGAGSGSMNPKRAKEILLDELARFEADLEVRVVVYVPPCRGSAVS